ncbi:prolactin receptor-like [Parambassis ranga]|uniref:Prolactin receptor-like n=1 Tax=Parambassis ranga TaxID=210632 RepID=A0A6P7HYD7_9TELE|nr:prolactin receptor-like [Parambassis ranga]
MMWLLLPLLLPLVGCSRIIAKDVTHNDRHSHEVAVVTTARPHIYYCRSPNMEDFTCWWHPLDNLTDGEAVSYVLTYSKDKGPKHECPDYLTAGPNSCHFDSSHTTIWKIYCMNVTAVTSHGNYSSQEHCLDVAEIVQTEAPVNLTYALTDAGGDEMGHNAQLSWTYPVPSDLQYGWITLVYELQYRRVTEPDNWKVKHPLHEPHVELLGLPVGDYVIRVRCRSRNYGLWSRWSSTLSMSIPARPPAGKLLVLILLTGVGVVALLVITFGVIPQSKRIKDYFLPPIPKPRIIGIDDRLLKKGDLDEINHHFSNFHSYRPPSYSEEVWDQVSTDEVFLTTPRDCSVPGDHADNEKDSLMVPCSLAPVVSPASYVQSMAPYCSLPPDAFAPSLDVPSPWVRPEIVSFPGTDYSVTVPPSDPATVTTSHPPQDFYTCVQLMNESGEVRLVPCLPPAYCRELPPVLRVRPDAAEEEKKKLTDYQVKNLMKGLKDSSYSERSEASVPLLPAAVDTKG